MDNALTLPEFGANELIAKHADVIAYVGSHLPQINEQSEIFFRSGSQYKTDLLDVPEPTPCRRVKQLLAKIHRTMGGFREAKYKAAKNAKEAEIKLRDAERETDHLRADLLRIEAAELEEQVQAMVPTIAAASRKVAGHIAQYKEILISLGKGPNDQITEEEFEREEEKFHIMTAFSQALISARPRGGTIDEGNQIYMHQIGINGAAAQVEVRLFMNAEQAIFAAGGVPDHAMVRDWLNSMYEKFKGCSAALLEWKGMRTGLLEEAMMPRLESSV